MLLDTGEGEQSAGWVLYYVATRLPQAAQNTAYMSIQ